MLPVLQVIHVSDVHFKHSSASAVHPLNAKRRFAARMVHRLVERFDLFDWNEGTQGHYPKAPESFQRFLEGWRAEDKRWYGTVGDDDTAQTWLVDTGDLTAFGDDESLSIGQEHLQAWRTVLGDCQMRTLFGNHDAWPNTLPVYALIGFSPSDIDRQREKIAKYPGWNKDSWISAPLSVTIPGTEARGGSKIELYALDTVCWGSVVNTLAVGDVDDADLTALADRLRKHRGLRSVRNFRILAMHHPIAYPYSWSERHSLVLFPAMRLLWAEKLARQLRNDADDPKGLGPHAHLFLSGHTHVAYPAGALPSNVGDIHQGALASSQLQLVNGALMLNKSRKAAKRSPNGPQAPFDRTRQRFVPATLDPGHCQAQILRFFSDEKRPGQLTLIRIPVSSIDGSVYVPGEPATVTLHFDTPAQL